MGSGEATLPLQGARPTLVDSDRDTLGASWEIGDFDSSGLATLSDVVFIAKAMLTASPPTRTGDFDVNRNGFVSTSGLVAAGRIALVSGFCPS